MAMSTGRSMGFLGVVRSVERRAPAVGREPVEDEHVERKMASDQNG